MSSAAAVSAPVADRSLSAVMKATSRRIMIVGSPGTGKTTFSVSASAYAGDTIPRSDIALCKDVAVLQGDAEGVIGAYSAGFEPGMIFDLSSVPDWAAYEKETKKAIAEIKAAGDVIRYLVIDVGLIDQLLRQKIQPDNVKQWGQVGDEAYKFFNLFHALRGVTIIGNAHIKASAAIVETQQGVTSSNARAMGGERTAYSTDLSAGTNRGWRNATSLQIARETKREKVGGGYQIQYFSHTQSDNKFEAKSRFASRLQPTEPGERTLRSLLQQAYGDLL